MLFRFRSEIDLMNGRTICEFRVSRGPIKLMFNLGSRKPFINARIKTIYSILILDDAVWFDLIFSLDFKYFIRYLVRCNYFMNKYIFVQCTDLIIYFIKIPLFLINTIQQELFSIFSYQIIFWYIYFKFGFHTFEMTFSRERIF